MWWSWPRCVSKYSIFKVSFTTVAALFDLSLDQEITLCIKFLAKGSNLIFINLTDLPLGPPVTNICIIMRQVEVFYCDRVSHRTHRWNCSHTLQSSHRLHWRSLRWHSYRVAWVLCHRSCIIIQPNSWLKLLVFLHPCRYLFRLDLFLIRLSVCPQSLLSFLLELNLQKFTFFIIDVGFN